jgi:hypothetical protein
MKMVLLIVLVLEGTSHDANAVSLADLLQTNGTINEGSLRFEHFVVSVSTEPNAGPLILVPDAHTTDLSGTMLNGNPGLRLTRRRWNLRMR